jgi:hypothetical protein
MENVEEMALEMATHKPLCWFRYVDDTFVIWPHGPSKLANVLDHLNGVHENIKFTMEMATYHSWTLIYTVNLMVHWATEYCNHPSNKQAVLSMFVYRARALCDHESLYYELEFLRDTFEWNGYSDGRSDGLSLNPLKRVATALEKPTTVAIVPFVNMTLIASAVCCPGTPSSLWASLRGKLLVSFSL